MRSGNASTSPRTRQGRGGSAALSSTSSLGQSRPRVVRPRVMAGRLPPADDKPPEKYPARPRPTAGNGVGAIWVDPSPQCLVISSGYSTEWAVPRQGYG